MKKGILITFEGGEGAGKSTHIRFVASYFRRKGRKGIIVREPGSTPIGEQIRHILLHPKNKTMAVETELFLYLAARAQLVKEVIQPALKKGVVVISDRFEDSTIVYQGYAGGFSINHLKKVAQAARGMIVPTLTFLLDLDVRKGLRRSGRKDRMEHKSLQFHNRIRRGFLALAKQNPRRFIVISSEAPKTAVQKKIKEKLDHVFS
ncbi:MAG: dTMP kinase [Omnitrophica bacterium RIFCSPHIGHO2_02_FULL_46_11]|nr:MAG: dTMP kinase [Omnitrophica bacterium RIFCSPLOWO2_01_FULL_45_10b]OGW87726.1 MAG: dTMP kinase [Omnitrophica bacterium RIFCSPHIGHO2_02_FULL_46_11]